MSCIRKSKNIHFADKSLESLQASYIKLHDRYLNIALRIDNKNSSNLLKVGHFVVKGQVKKRLVS